MIYLPYDDFRLSALTLESDQLEESILGAVQRLALGPSGVDEWSGYERALWNYARTLCMEWYDRYHRHHDGWSFILVADKNLPSQWRYPDWHGDLSVHTEHREALFQLNPEAYEGFEC